MPVVLRPGFLEEEATLVVRFRLRVFEAKKGSGMLRDQAWLAEGWTASGCG